MSMPTRNLNLIIAAAIVSLLCYGEAARNRFAGVLSEAIDLVAREYVRPVEPRQLFENAMQGMLTRLDPYSGYIPPERYSQFKVEIEQQFGGVGIQVELRDERLTVLSPIPGTPAYEAGLLAGDVIVEIQGHRTDGMSLDEAVVLMRGAPGTTVVVKVVHPGQEEPVEYRIQRAVIQIESVRGYDRADDDQWRFFLPDHPEVGYVRLTNFGDQSAEELRRVLGEVAQQRTGLIIDVRGNAGGLLSAAIEICDMFVAPEALIVSTRGREGKLVEEYFAENPPEIDPRLPVVVLVDRFSASASEIFAACLQDHQRAEIIGERTWGKGTVQNVIEIEGGRGAIRLTTQTYWRPSGKNIHRHLDDDEDDPWGVTPRPPYLIPLTDEQHVKLFELWRAREIAPSRRQGAADASTAADASAANGQAANHLAGPPEEAFVDPHLQRAIEYLTQPSRPEDGSSETVSGPASTPLSN